MVIGSAPIGGQTPHIAGRQLLRSLYESTYGTAMPGIATTPRGKPYFVEGKVHFSISHTAGWVFCVLSERPVGIDAEATNRNIRLELAEKILSAGEQAHYARAVDKRDALLRFWVLKEAAAKCSGEGLRGYPSHTDFSPDDPRIRVMDGCYVAIIEEQENSYVI